MPNCSKEDMRIISEIADRALGLPWPGERPTKLDMLMDLTAAHEHTPLNLMALYSAPEPHFSHDIGGIRRHLNRETMKLEDAFTPRYALR